MPILERIYCDTNVFISYFNQVQERLIVLESLFENVSNNNSHILITSVIAKVEVSWIETAAYSVSNSDDLERLDEFWKDSNLIQMVEFNDSIAEIARNIMRHAKGNGWKFNKWGIDSIHLATAMWANAKEFHTYDTEFMKFGPYTGLRIGKPQPGQLNMNI